MGEEELALQCKQANNRARKQLYEQYGGLLMAICLRYTRVMVNEALGYLRKKNLQIQQEVLMDDIPDTLEADDGDMNEIPRSVLMKMIAELPDGYRTVFNLYVFEEKSHKEIAALLGITEHTSSSQFYRAKTLLIKKINEYRKKL